MHAKTTTYAWTSAKTGEEIKLFITSGASELRARFEAKAEMEFRGIKLSGSVDGTSIHGEITLHGWQDDKRANVHITIPDEIADKISADLHAAAARFEYEFWHGTHSYRVNEDSEYRSYNGFGPSVGRMIRLVLKSIDPEGHLSLNDSDRDIVHKVMGWLRSRFEAQAQATYTPRPADPTWCPEALKRHEELVAARKAAGTAEIKAEEIRTMIEALLRDEIEYRAPWEIHRIDALLKNAKDISDEQARREEYQYNLIHNNGGDGYVPHVVGRGEAEALRKRKEGILAILESIRSLPSLRSLDGFDAPQRG